MTTPEQMGRFIQSLRRERGMTQKLLAEQLQITDKAVSKWERGLSCPDITLLPALSAALGVTVGELLNGARDIAPADPAHCTEAALGYAAQTRARDSRALRRRLALAWGLALLAGALVCGICNLALAGRLSWSLIPAAGCLLAWCITRPLIRWGTQGIQASLGWLTGLIAPFLWALDRVLNGLLHGPRPGGGAISVLPIGLLTAAPGLAFLWGCYGAARLWRARPLRAGAACAGLAILTCLAEETLLSLMLNLPLLDAWDLLTIGLLAALAAALLWLDGREKRRDLGRI